MVTEVRYRIFVRPKMKAQLGWCKTISNWREWSAANLATESQSSRIHRKASAPIYLIAFWDLLKSIRTQIQKIQSPLLRSQVKLLENQMQDNFNLPTDTKVADRKVMVKTAIVFIAALSLRAASPILTIIVLSCCAIVLNAWSKSTVPCKSIPLSD